MLNLFGMINFQAKFLDTINEDYKIEGAFS